MRSLADKDRLESFCAALGKHVRGPGRIYLVGGATAVFHGWRETTIDIDLKALPEPPGWEERSPFIAHHGQLDFHHYDPYSQVLAKIERGHPRDLTDSTAMVASGLVEPHRLRDLFAAIKPALICYPSIQPEVFEKSLTQFLESTPQHP